MKKIAPTSQKAKDTAEKIQSVCNDLCALHNLLRDADDRVQELWQKATEIKDFLDSGGEH